MLAANYGLPFHAPAPVVVKVDDNAKQREWARRERRNIERIEKEMREWAAKRAREEIAA